MNFNEDFFTRLDEFSSSPFLFIGSGFSKRYLNAVDWEGLLRMYSAKVQIPFERYRSLAGGSWPKVGSLIAKDYHTYWFESPDLDAERHLNMQEMVTFSSPLKVSISNYLSTLSRSEFPDELHSEIDLLKAAKINGVITTNYDMLCERIYPEFKVYKSQQELIFSSLQEIGEIYKIHGCCTEPNTLIITEEDYEQFNERNAYLAAKLLTVFLEHPTIFMGYSISDVNVRNILSSIIRCLDQGQVNELSSRLFFVQYINDHEGEPIIDKYEFEIGGSILPLTRIRTKEYKSILEVLTSLHQKFPAALLRKIKEHIYELVNTNDPNEKIAVVNFNQDTDLEKVDIVIGIGVAGKSDKSYETYTRFDIAEDILYGNKNFDITELISKTLPKLVKAPSWIPVCKYLRLLSSQDNVDPKIISAATRPLSAWQEGNPYSYKRTAINKSFNSLSSVLESNAPDKAVKIILLLEVEKIELSSLCQFLKDNFNLTQDQQHSSYFMKLLCLYDRLNNS